MSLAALAGPLASIGGSILGFMGAKDKNKEARAAADLEYARQKEFAQSGIRWKVEDAHAAGVHPLFALGASTSSYAPQSIGMENEMAHLGKGLADMGADVSRAAQAQTTKSERAAVVARDAIALEGMQLDNDIKRASLASALQKLNSPGTGPGIPEDDSSKRPPLLMGGKKWDTDPSTSNVEDFEKRYGEPAEWFAAPGVVLNDAKRNKVGAVELLRSIWGWLDRNADPEFGNKLVDQIIRGRR